MQIRPALILFVLALLAAGCGTTASNSSDTGVRRIVAVGGAATEIVYALGAGDELVGTDTSSIYPEEATRLPQVGYQRQLSAEGVLSLKPTVVIALPEAGPPAAIQQLESAGVRVIRVNNDASVDGAKIKIRQIAEALGRREKGEELVAKLESELSEVQQLVTSMNGRPKVMFIYSRGSGSPHVGGLNTPAEGMIKLAGGTNAVTGFSDYKPLTPEAMVAAQPDVILAPARGLSTMGGVDAVLAMPGVADTPAGRNKKIVAVDDMLLLGFTPRLAEGVRDLAQKIR